MTPKNKAKNKALIEALAEKGFISAADAAQWTGRDISTIYRWMHGGAIKGVRSGGNFFVERESLRIYAGIRVK